MAKEFTMDADFYRRTAYERATHNAERLQAIIHQIQLHAMVKGHLLAGRSQTWIAKHSGVGKKTVGQVAGTPLTALQALHDEFGVDAEPLLCSIFDTPDGVYDPVVTARGAITACMAYDCEHVTPGEDSTTLEVRYSTSLLDMLAHVQHVHGHVVVHHAYNHDPGRSAETVDYCARKIGCEEEWIARAKTSIETWLTTPIVPEISNLVYRTSYNPSSPRRLDDRLCILRREREDAEIVLYGACRPTVDDNDESPESLARDLLLAASGANSQINKKDRYHAVQSFGKSIGIDTGGRDKHAQIITDDDEELLELVDAALYDVHGVHLPHLQLASDRPWPFKDRVLPPPSWVTDPDVPLPPDAMDGPFPTMDY